MEKLRIFDVLWILAIVFSGEASSEMSVLKTSTYFFGEGGVGNPSSVTWAHAVNSKKLLEDALSGDKMMLEADINMGTKKGSSDEIPIMAHPPDATSDLSFQEFIDRFIDFVSNSNVKKGIKLDFKNISAVEPSLQILQGLSDTINFPVWLNADVLQGPVDATTVPVDKHLFLNLTQEYFPNSTLSLGWTTHYGCNSTGGYEKSHIDEMIELLAGQKELKDRNFEDFAPTFPVRAGIAAETNLDYLMNLIGTFPSSTLTLWSPDSDPINMTKLHSLLDSIGLNRIYIDVPFNLTTGPGVTCEDKNHSTTTTPKPSSNDISGSVSTSNKSLYLLTFLTACLFVRRYF